jgi:uncharacterized membrane protein
VAKQNRRPAGASQAARGATSPGRPGSQATSVTPGRNPVGQSAAAAAQRAPANGKASAAPGRASAPAQSAVTPLWLRVMTLVFSVYGLGASIYLTIVHLTSSGFAFCSSKGFENCAAVTTSPQSKVFGVLPVAELGLAFYLFMVLINLPWAWRPVWSWLPGRLSGSGRQQTLPVLAWRLRLGSIIVGIMFVLYLIYTELITLRAICLWCTSVHVATFLIFVLLIVQATLWGPQARSGPASRPGQPASN